MLLWRSCDELEASLRSSRNGNRLRAVVDARANPPAGHRYDERLDAWTPGPHTGTFTSCADTDEQPSALHNEEASCQ